MAVVLVQSLGSQPKNVHILSRVQERRLVPAPLHLLRAEKLLFAEGDVGDDVYQLVSGCIRFFKVLPNGTRMVAGFAVPGEPFSLSHNGIHLFSAEAVTDCSFRRVKRSIIADGRTEFSSSSSRVLEMLRNEPWLLQAELLKLLHKSADESLAYFIFSMARRTAPVLADGSSVKLEMSRADIADYLGLTVETVCRGLKRLMKEGILTAKGPHLITIKDMRALKRKSCADAAATDVEITHHSPLVAAE